MRMSQEAMGHAAAGAVGLLVLVGLMMLGFQRDKRERELLASGTCTLLMEALYTPPPVAHTSCGAEGRNCTTSFSQADPYMRSLWRCPDPERAGAEVEFWRRSAERRMW